jgi:ribosomal-protein-alanine N-acetyltransferase
MSDTAMEHPRTVPTLMTERLELSAIQSEDAESYFALCSDADVMRTFGLLPHASIENTHSLISYLERELEAQRMIRWAVRERGGNGELIGDVGFWRYVPERRRAEIGSKLAARFWNKGYMTEAMRAAMDFGFKQMRLNSIEGNADPENLGSLKMLAKLGYEREGLVKEHTYCPYRERYFDTILYSVRASQWKVNSHV